VRVFKNTWFTRFAVKEGIIDSELKAIVDDVLEAGQAEADLGGGVYKLRFARPGEGKSGGYRVIVYFKSGGRTFYVYGFAKSSRENISQKELRKFKENSQRMQALTEDQIQAWLKDGTLYEIT
jgi:hypothetical protein